MRFSAAPGAIPLSITVNTKNWIVILCTPYNLDGLFNMTYNIGSIFFTGSILILFYSLLLPEYEYY